MIARDPAGKRRPTPFRLLAPALLSLLLAGCAAQQAYREGNELVAQDRVEAGLAKYQEALAADPQNVVYKAAWLRARDGAVNRLLTQADRALADGKPDLAQQDYRRVLAVDPVNDRARAGLRQVEADRRHALLLDEARAALARKDLEPARQKVVAFWQARSQRERLLLGIGGTLALLWLLAGTLLPYPTSPPGTNPMKDKSASSANAMLSMAITSAAVGVPQIPAIGLAIWGLLGGGPLVELLAGVVAVVIGAIVLVVGLHLGAARLERSYPELFQKVRAFV